MCRIYFAFLAIGGALSFSSGAYAEISHSTEVEKMATSKFEQPGAVQFTPPQGWRFAAPQSLPKSVHIMVVGEGQHEYPPSMNLGTESYRGSLKEYLKVVKAINDAQGAEWKDLGTIRTDAGEASLSQVDMKTTWGDVREMHVILVKNETVYILTAAALKEEFPKFYKDFFRSMRSLRINKNAFEMVTDSKRRMVLQKAIAELDQAWETSQISRENIAQEMSKEVGLEKAFEDKEFQEKYWIPFTIMLEKQYSDMGLDWKSYLLVKTKNELMAKMQ